METIVTKEAIDLKEAEDNLQNYLKLQTQKAAIAVSMKAYESKLKDFFTNNENLHNDKGHLILTAGELYNSNKTVVKYPKRFSVVKFIQKFPALIKWEFSVSGMKVFFKNEKELPKLKAFGLKLKEEPEFKIIAAKPDKEADKK
jgi:hypothetical protein